MSDCLHLHPLVLKQKITFTSISTTKITYIQDDADGTYLLSILALQGWLNGPSEALKAPVGVKVEERSSRSQGSMSSPKKAPRKKKPRNMTADELMKEINKLNSLLQDKLKIERDTEEEEYQALLHKMVGRRVLITVKGSHQGKEGVITRHAGDTFHPVNW